MNGISYSRHQVLTSGLVGLGALVAESSLGLLRRGAFAAEECPMGGVFGFIGVLYPDAAGYQTYP
jgi:hypothetical protein